MNKGEKEDDLYLANVELSSTQTDLDRDIIVLVKSEAANEPVVLYENGENNVLMLSTFPRKDIKKASKPIISSIRNTFQNSKP